MGVGPSTLLATFSATCLEALMRHSSMCSTTLRISSTRLLSCLHAGPAPKQNLKARKMFCWLRMGWQFSDRLEPFFDMTYMPCINFQSISSRQGDMMLFIRKLPWADLGLSQM